MLEPSPNQLVAAVQMQLLIVVIKGVESLPVSGGPGASAGKFRPCGSDNLGCSNDLGCVSTNLEVEVVE